MTELSNDFVCYFDFVWSFCYVGLLADATVSGFKNAAIAGVVASGPVVSNLYSLGDTPGSEFKPQCVLDNLKSILIVWDGSLGLSNPEEAL